MSRAEQFVKSFKKGMETLRENKPKDMAIFVYIYARDINARDDKNPDGEIWTDKLGNRTKYDDYWIRQDIDEFMLKD